MAGRRGNNEGLIRKRDDGRWEARITLDDGKTKSFYAKTRQEVARRLNEALRDKEQGLPVVDERQTIEQYCASWLESTKHTVKPKTWKYYGDFVRLHIVPVLGRVRLAKLTAQQIQSLYAKKLSEGLSQTTVNHLHAVLHKALNNAVRLGLVQRNVSDMVDPPRMNHPEMETFSAIQVQQLLAAASGDRLEALYVLALSTGMRQGELLALRWRDVDLDRATLRVKATLQSIKGNLSLAEPKTEGSWRLIALTKRAVDALRQHQQRQEGEQQLLGDVWDYSLDLVFPNRVGRLMDPTHLLRREYYALLKRAGLPIIRFHDLRHTAATLLLGQRVNVKVVSEMLGHADVATTMRIYAHVLPHMQAEAVDAMDELLRDADG